MGVYIEGMDMPKNCSKCPFCDWSNLHQTAACKRHDFDPCFEDHSREYTYRRAYFCPLFEVSEPHGDLIDRGALNIGEYEREDDDTGTLEISLVGLLDLYHKVKDALIVIEAEGSDDE